MQTNETYIFVYNIELFERENYPFLSQLKQIRQMNSITCEKIN